MIDTGCQVTILATSVFERMYTCDQPSVPVPAPAMPPAIGVGRLISADGLL